MVAVVDVVGVGKPSMGFTGSGAKDGCQTGGILHRAWAQDKGIESSKDGRIHGDAEGQSQNRDAREAWILAKDPKAVTKILQEGFEEREGTAVAVDFLGLLDAAELDEGLAVCFCGIHTGPKVVFDVQLEMAVHFGGEIAITPVFAKEAGESEEERAQLPHADSFPGDRKRARISVVCSHSRASLSNCLRPARVSL